MPSNPQTKKKTARKVSNNMYTNQIIFFELFIWRALIYYKINVFWEVTEKDRLLTVSLNFKMFVK